MKNSGFEAWKARLDFMAREFPFTSKEEGIVQIRNEDGNLHADDGPAWRSPSRIIWYQNGRKHGVDADILGSIHYYYENIRIPHRYHLAIKDPSLLTVEEVLGHANAEVRFVGMKIIGFDAVRKSKKSKTIHRDKKIDAELFHIKGIFEEPVAFVAVWNSTAEEDGSFKRYYLCVPPSCKTCREAIAWTFRMTEEEYFPSQET